MAPQMATGGAFQEGAKRKTDQDCLDARVAGNPGHRAADDRELAGLDRQVVDQHRAENGPTDGQQPVADAVNEGHAGHFQWHFEDQPGNEHGAQRPGSAGLRCQPASFHQQVEQNQDRHRGEEGGNDLAVGKLRAKAGDGIQVLGISDGPRHGESSSLAGGSNPMVTGCEPDASARGLFGGANLGGTP